MFTQKMIETHHKSLSREGKKQSTPTWSTNFGVRSLTGSFLIHCSAQRLSPKHLNHQKPEKSQSFFNTSPYAMTINKAISILARIESKLLI